MNQRKEKYFFNALNHQPNFKDSPRYDKVLEPADGTMVLGGKMEHQSATS